MKFCDDVVDVQVTERSNKYVRHRWQKHYVSDLLQCPPATRKFATITIIGVLSLLHIAGNIIELTIVLYYNINDNVKVFKFKALQMIPV